MSWSPSQALASSATLTLRWAVTVRQFWPSTGVAWASSAVKVAFAPTAEEGWEHAYRLWPNSGIPGELSQVLPTPEHFEQATELVTPEMIRDSTVAGNDPEQHLAQIQEYADAGFDELYVANMGPHFEDMIRFYGEQVLPQLR